MATFTKDPQAVLDYGWDWTNWLAGGETITTSTWTITLAPDAILTIATPTFDGTSTTIWASAGTVGSDYKITNHITTSAGRQDDRTHKLQVRDR